jgi:hypothetical protein
MGDCTLDLEIRIEVAIEDIKVRLSAEDVTYEEQVFLKGLLAHLEH